MKKILATTVALSLLLALSSSCVALESDAWKENKGTINLSTLTVSGDGISVSENVVTIVSGGDFDVTGTLSDGMIRICCEEKVKLRLSGMSLTNTTGPAIYFENAKKAFITITEETKNYLCDGKEYLQEDADATLFSNDDLEIKGNGTLVIDANYQHAIASDDDLSIENSNIEVNSYEHCIKVNDKLEILGGNLMLTSETGKGMKAGKELIIEDGDITIISKASEGIESKGLLTINGGDIDITAADDGINTGSEDTASDATAQQSALPENIQNTMPDEGNDRHKEMMQGSMTPPEGMENFDPSRMPPPENIENFDPSQMPPCEGMPAGGRGGMDGGFEMVDEETAAAHAISINGGNIYINADGDGIDSNGNLSITGGTLVIDGPQNNGNGPLDSQGTMTITGGTIDILSSAGMIQLPRSEDTLNRLQVAFSQNGSTDDIIEIKDEDGNTLASHKAVKTYRAFIYMSEKLKSDKTYSVYLNNELYANVTVSDEVGFMGGGMKGERPAHNNKKDRISVSLNGASLRFNTDPILRDGTTLVGFRSILEALGAEVGYDQDTKTVTATKDGISIVLTINSKTAKVNGEEKELLQAPQIINDSTMIPVRFVSEELGMNVEWDNDTRHITISSK